MRAFRIGGYHRLTGEHLVAQVQAIDLEKAYQLMAITHKRLSCLGKKGVEL